MVALDTRFAMLAAQCMLTLVAVSPPAAAVAVRSPHSNHGEDAGSFHRLHSPVIPAPNEKKLNSASKKHKGHKSSGASVDKESRAPSSNPPHAMFNTFGTEQPSDQKTRDSFLVGDVGGILEAVEGFLKEVLPLTHDVLQRRHHGEYHFHDHDREKIIIEDNPLHVDVYKRTFLQHARPSRRGDTVEERRDPEGVPGSVAVVSDGDEMFLVLNQSASELVASEENASKMYLVDASPSSSSFSPRDIMTVPVRLLCDPASASGQVSCVTFNCNSSLPQPMNVTPCDNSPGGAEGRASQLFSYNLASQELRPLCSNINGSGADPMEGKGALLDTRDPGKYNNAMLLFRPSLAPDDFESASATSEAPASVTTVTVTTTATLTEPTSGPVGAANMALTSASENSSQESTSVSSLSSTPSPATFNVEVALPSTTTADNFSTSSSSAPSTTATPAGSEASSSPRPASFVVQAEEEEGDSSQ